MQKTIWWQMKNLPKKDMLLVREVLLDIVDATANQIYYEVPKIRLVANEAKQLSTRTRFIIDLLNQTLEGIKSDEYEVDDLRAILDIAVELIQKLSRKIGGVRGVALNRPNLVFAKYWEKLGDAKEEHFYAVLVNSKMVPIKEVLVSKGSLNFSIVHPRETFAEAITKRAYGIILVHNHPTGDPTPSQEDLNVTKRLMEVGKLVGIDILDHIIIGNGCYLSFQEHRLAGL